MQKEILKAVVDNKGNICTVICANGVEMVAAWLALSDAIARALEQKPLLKGDNQRQAMLSILAKSLEDKNFVEHVTDNCDDDADDDCNDCGHCDSQHECSFYNKAVEHGMSKEEAMLLALLDKIIGGKK